MPPEKPVPAPAFHCYRCRKEVNQAPDPPAVAVCEDCCHETSGHDYQYMREERGHFCAECGAPVPEGYYDE